MNKGLKRQIALLEKLTGYRVVLVENNEATKNLATESLKQVSETLDLLKSNVDMAISKLEILSGQDTPLTKLRGLSSIVDANITEVAEIIAEITGITTADDALQEDVEMTSDEALNNVDKVKKLAQNDVNVVINDDQKNPNS